MKLGGAVLAANEWRFLPAVAGQLLRVVDRLLVVRNARSFSGAPVELGPVPALDARIEVVEGSWEGERQTRNAALGFLSDCDYVLMVDSDEVLLDWDLEELWGLCRKGRSRVITVDERAYWKTPEWRIESPFTVARPVVLARGVQIEHFREVEGASFQTDVRIRHLVYALTDAEVREKHRLTSHARAIRTDWYERVWKAWDADPDLENLHPVYPPAFRKALYAPEPELEEVLGRWGCRREGGPVPVAISGGRTRGQER